MKQSQNSHKTVTKKMDIDNKKYIENRAELERLATEFEKKHPLTPLQKRKLKALREKIIRIVEITKKTYPGKKGWKYLEYILDKNPDLYPLLRNHVIKLTKNKKIELTIQANEYLKDEHLKNSRTLSLYNETIGEEAENIMREVFQSEWRDSNIKYLERIPLDIINEIRKELKNKKYDYKHLAIVSPKKDIEDGDIKIEKGCINENDNKLVTEEDTPEDIILKRAEDEARKKEYEKITKIAKEKLTKRRLEVFRLRINENGIKKRTFREIEEILDIDESTVREHYKLAIKIIKKHLRNNP